MFRFYCVVVATLFIDQLSKFYVIHYLNLKQKLYIDVFSPLVTFQMAWNRGINFGFFGSGGTVSKIFLITISLLICVALYWWVRSNKDAAIRICVGLIIGGAIGNVIDRIIFGAVADFLNMSCCGVNNPFSFNLADIAIFFGAIGLIFFNKTERLEGSEL